MPLDRAEAAALPKEPNAAWLFFKRWMARPLQMASITPSSPQLSRLIASEAVFGPDEVVVEFGGGTGAITRALLEHGVPANRLYTVERDPELAPYLRRHFPAVNILEGDVVDVRKMLPPHLVGKVGSVICGIPMILIPTDAQRAIVEEIFAIMPKGRRFYAYTYSARSPLKRKELGIQGERVGFTIANVPPASVWGYWRD
jgi:phosphatidylethanolamine/phosphatidyl-N-methylethanolamine N-methyltransferase